METFEFLDRAGDGSDEVTNVELGYLRAGIFSAVLQGEFDLDRVGGGIFTAVESYVGIFKGGVAQAVAEREERAVAAVEVVGGAAVGGLAGFERKVHKEGLGAGVRTAGVEVL